MAALHFVNVSDLPFHCTAPVMWGPVRPWATMLGSSVLLWFEACNSMILTLDGNIFREQCKVKRSYFASITLYA